MPRVARIVLPRLPHHITQRGNNRQDVFFVDEDRQLYLRFLAEESRRWGLSLLGYCLMTNHVHLIAIPKKPDSLARALGRAHWRYAQTINRLHGRSGHLWQNRFYSAPLDAHHLLLAMRYVEQNPSRAQLCARPWEYPWSSAARHCGQATDDDDLLNHSRWHQSAGDQDWRQTLEENLEEMELQRMRTTTQQGRPLATNAWLSKLETKLGRRLRPSPVGRPPIKVRK